MAILSLHVYACLCFVVSWSYKLLFLFPEMHNQVPINRKAGLTPHMACLKLG